MTWEIVYYNERLKAWLRNMPLGIRAKYAEIVERMKIAGPNLGMPFTRLMESGLYEIRARGLEGAGRVFYCTMVENKIVMLHGFIKKPEKTPWKELETARRRMKEVKNVQD